MANEFEDDIRFSEFLSDISDKYPGADVRYLRLLLHDHLSIDILSDTNIMGLALFNELKKQGKISNTDVKILYEIAIVTRNDNAVQIIKNFTNDTLCDGGKITNNKLSPHRKALFTALKNVGTSDLHKVCDFYQLRAFKFDNIWDLVFHLEKAEKLDYSPTKWNRFGKRLNKKAESILLDVPTHTEGKPSTSSTVTTDVPTHTEGKPSTSSTVTTGEIAPLHIKKDTSCRTSASEIPVLQDVIDYANIQQSKSSTMTTDPGKNAGDLKVRAFNSFKFKEDEDKIGSGSFGKVYKAFHPDFNDVAIKTLNSEEEARREAEKMRKLLQYPPIMNILCLVSEGSEDKKIIGFAMERMKLGNLKDFQQKQVKNIPWPLRMRMLKEISEGMYYLHHCEKPEVVHGDLKAENIFVQETLSVKIGDLGLTRSMQSIMERPNNVGTVTHMPPEYFHINQVPNLKWDVYSFAIVQMEIGVGKVYEGLQGSVPRLKLLVANLGKRPPLTDLPEDCPHVVKELIKKCWDQDAKKRPDFKDIKEQIKVAYQNNYEMSINEACIDCLQQISENQANVKLENTD